MELAVHYGGACDFTVEMTQSLILTMTGDPTERLHVEELALSRFLFSLFLTFCISTCLSHLFSLSPSLSHFFFDTGLLSPLSLSFSPSASPVFRRGWQIWTHK